MHKYILVVGWDGDDFDRSDGYLFGRGTHGKNRTGGVFRYSEIDEMGWETIS